MMAPPWPSCRLLVMLPEATEPTYSTALPGWRRLRRSRRYPFPSVLPWPWVIDAPRGRMRNLTPLEMERMARP